MRVHRKGAVAVVLAAVLGVMGGIAVAFAVPSGSPGGADDPPAAQDPLGLGVPLENLDCTGQSIVVVGVGDSAAPLAVAVTDNPEGGVRYLRTRDSCRTIYAGPEQPVPTYVAYLGPYDSVAEPCRTRMTIDHRGDAVTRLRQGNDVRVKCVCELPTADFPDLRVGMEQTALTALYVDQLQQLLFGMDPERFPEEAVTGFYDQRTADRIKPIQTAGQVIADGVVDQVTWRIVRDRGCGSFDY